MIIYRFSCYTAKSLELDLRMETWCLDVDETWVEASHFTRESTSVDSRFKCHLFEI